MGGIADTVKGVIGGVTGQTGAKASRQAGALQASAIREASKLGAESQEEIRKLIENQLGITREQFAPFLAAGTGALPGVEEASTIGGLDSRIAQILGSESFQPLVEERTRSVEGLLGAGGLTRSGAAITEGAKIPTDLAFQIENLLSGRESNLAQTGLRAAAQSAGQEGDFLNQIIQSITGGTQALTSGITGAAQVTASGILGAAQSQAAGTQNLLNLGGTLGAASILAPAAIAASDPRLKKNVVKIGHIGELNVYSWDYIDEIKDLGIASMHAGFMSDEVKEIFPEHIYELGGYDLIDYTAVLNELETWH
jgi:hypothetical protein